MLRQQKAFFWQSPSVRRTLSLTKSLIIISRPSRHIRQTTTSNAKIQTWKESTPERARGCFHQRWSTASRQTEQIIERSFSQNRVWIEASTALSCSRHKWNAARKLFYIHIQSEEWYAIRKIVCTSFFFFLHQELIRSCTIKPGASFKKMYI